MTSVVRSVVQSRISLSESNKINGAEASFVPVRERRKTTKK